MSDLFSPFRDAEQLPTPPVDDVRHRGEALRRRRRALQAGGAAVAVAAVALAAVGLVGGADDRSSEPPVATQPTSAPTQPASPPASPPTEIPARLDLAQGWQAQGSEEQLRQGPQVSWIADEVACDADHSPLDRETDRSAAVLTMPQHTSGRDLRVFADEATAQQVAADFVGWFRDCPSFSLDSGASETTNTVVNGDRLGHSWVVMQTYTSGGQPQFGQNILFVEQVGNAVLVAKDYGEGPGSTDQAGLLRSVTALETETQPLVDELTCTFGEAGADC